MSVTRIYSYKTSDESLFAEPAAAHTHQLMLDVRGVMQSNSVGKLGTMTVTDAATFFAAHATELSDALRNYKEKMRRIKP